VVADDDAAARESMARALTKAGYVCRTACDATEARRILGQEEFDLVIADIQMPGNDRLQLVSELAAALPMPPILLVTGQPTLETAVQAAQSRVVGYLIKPYSVDDLLRVVQREVHAQQAYRFICQRRARVEDTLREMQRLEQTMGDTRLRSTDEAVGTYIKLTSEQLLASVHDLCILMEGVMAREGSEQMNRRLAGSRPFVLLDAVREAVLVLERTKTSFKSKELADLRRKLEVLLGPSSSGGGVRRNESER